MKMLDIHNQPLVSVIMNCFNADKYLGDAIDSVFNQTYENWEIIFWDNLSTDESSKIAKSYGPRLKYFSGASHVPLGQARNLAINEANGSYLAFLDCDDIWMEEKLELQIRAMQRYPDSVIGFGITSEKYEDGVEKVWEQRMLKKLKTEVLDCYQCPGALITIGCFIAMSCAVIKRDIYLGVGGVDANLHYVEDYDLWLRASTLGKTVFVPSKLAIWRRHDQQNTLTKNSIAIREQAELFANVAIGKYHGVGLYARTIALLRCIKLKIKKTA
jgi:glycosyltransferase involved in cell wall biosynthesis